MLWKNFGVESVEENQDGQHSSDGNLGFLFSAKEASRPKPRRRRDPHGCLALGAFEQSRPRFASELPEPYAMISACRSSAPELSDN